MGIEKVVLGVIAGGAGLGYAGWNLLTMEDRWRKLGDVNGDGVIDEGDLNLIALAFGSVPGDPNWNPDADLNGDSMVDIFDAVLAGNNLGSDYRTWSEQQTLFAVAGAGAGIAIGAVLLYA